MFASVQRRWLLELKVAVKKRTQLGTKFGTQRHVNIDKQHLFINT
jgi:cell division septal protein FtsQ